ncbi:MAG: hypothetical protein ACOC8B_03180 [Gemmatimonadota bacterium]
MSPAADTIGQADVAQLDATAVDVDRLDQLTFSSARVDSNDEIFLVDPDGSNPTRITENSSTDLEVAWRPRPKA